MDLIKFDDIDNMLEEQSDKTEKPPTDDEIFGTAGVLTCVEKLLEDVLKSDDQDDIFQSLQEVNNPVNRVASKNVDSLFGADVDDEPDVFGSVTKPAEGSKNLEDTVDDFFNQDLTLSTTNHLRTLTSTETSTVKLEGTTKSLSSLDILLETQPSGTVPASDDLYSILKVNQVESRMSWTNSNEGKSNSSQTSTDGVILNTLLFSNASQSESSGSSSKDLFLTLEDHKMLQDISSDQSETLLEAEPFKVDAMSDDIPSIFECNKLELGMNLNEENIIHSEENRHFDGENNFDLLLDDQSLGSVSFPDDHNTITEINQLELNMSSTDALNAQFDKNKNSDDTVTERSSLSKLLLSEVNHSESSVNSPNDFNVQSEKNPKAHISFSQHSHEYFANDKPFGSLDTLLEAQPLGAMPSCDDHISIAEAYKSIDTSCPSKHLLSKKKLKDSQQVLLDNLEFSGDSTANTQSLERQDIVREPELNEDEDKLCVPKKTNMNKKIERSFDNLLHGLSDESEPELDDMISSEDYDNSKLESWEVEDVQKDQDNKCMETKLGDSECVTRINNEDFGNDFGNDINLAVVQDADRLVVDINKHRSSLSKQGSLAIRRKSSRKGRKSLLSTEKDAIFQDKTDLNLQDVSNGEDIWNDTREEGIDLSPPAKRPSPVMLVPLPGLSSNLPSQRRSASSPVDDVAMDTKMKRISKPPPGAFILPSFAAHTSKPPIKLETTERPKSETDHILKSPTLKSVKATDTSPYEKRQGVTFDKPVLRNIVRNIEKETENGEEDTNFGKSIIHSTPKSGISTKPRKVSLDEMQGALDDDVLENNNSIKYEQSDLSSGINAFHQDKLKHSEQKLNVKDENILEESGSNNDAINFEKAVVRTSNKMDSHDDNSNSFNAFEKPPLKIINRKPENSNESSESSHSFEKPVLKAAAVITNNENNVKPELGVLGTFEKPSLKKVSPSPEKEVKDLNESKGMFDKPPLKKIHSFNKGNTDKEKLLEKPAWLKEAVNKQGKVLNLLKENQYRPDGKQLPSWLEQSPLKKNRNQQFQDTSNNKFEDNKEENSAKQFSIHKIGTSVGEENDFERKQTSSPSDTSGGENLSERKRTASSLGNLEKVRTPSIGGDINSERKASCSSSSASSHPGSHNNYTPSWMRQGRSPAVSYGVVPFPTTTSNTVIDSKDIPLWKKELAQKNLNKYKKSQEESPVKGVSSEPEWKNGMPLTKLCHTTTPSKEIQSVEPEWKKAAEEKRARLRSKSVQYPYLK